MKLSIIVPVYNVKDYLEKCLDSIHAQKLDDYEVIVVDDGSTDGCSRLVDDFCRDKPRFHAYHKENGGLMSAWMFGVSMAKGDYLGFVDSDDYISDEMFSILSQKATVYDADIVMCDRFDVVGAQITEPKCNGNSLQEGIYVGDDMERIKEMVFPLPGIPELTKARWNKIFKRELYLANTKYCACLSKTFEDRYITPPCIFSANSLYYVRKPLYYYVHRSGSNSGMYKPDLLDQIKRLYFIQKRVLEDKNMMHKYKKNWEYVFMDYIRQYVVRNIKNVKSFHARVRSSKQLLNDALVKERIEEYGAQDRTRLGRALFFSYKLGSPLLLTVLSYL